MKSSVVNIESVTNSSFGTGFVIDSDEKGVFVLTCQHVLDDVGTPVVESVLAKVVAKSDFIDMAVLYVSKLHLEPLPLQIDECDNLDVEVIGFSHFNKSINQKKHINATLYQESIELHSTDDDLFYNVRKIKANDGFNFDRGNSGSPVICKSSGKIIAMISNKEGNDIGYAVDISNLKDIWADMPSRLLKNEIEQISGTKKDTQPKQKQKAIPKKEKSSPMKYLMLLIASAVIFMGTYLFISKNQSNRGVTNSGDSGYYHSDRDEIEKEREARRLEEERQRAIEEENAKREAEEKRIAMEEAEAKKRAEEEAKQRAIEEEEAKKEAEAQAKKEREARFEKAEKLEIKAFKYLIAKKYKSAVLYFRKAEESYPSFHQVKEIADYLHKRVGSMNKPLERRKTIQNIIKLAKDAPKELIDELKKQTKFIYILPDSIKKPRELNLTHIRRIDPKKLERVNPHLIPVK